MLIKFTLKNMFEKPLRLFVLLICVIVASFAGCLAMDIGDTMTSIFRGMMTEMLGTVDYIVAADKELTDASFEGCPDADILIVENVFKREEKREEKLYTYVLSENVSLWSFDDTEKAVRMGLLSDKISLNEGEAAISSRYSRKYGYEIGDRITLTDSDKQEFTVTVSSIFKEKGLFASGNGLTVIVPDSVTMRMNGYSDNSMAMVDVLNDDERAAFKEQFLLNHPNGSADDVFMTDDLAAEVKNITTVCALVFVLTFLLVIFVTASFTEKIVQERMAVVGTLRSIGISCSKAACILLFENLAYGLVGSTAGCVIYGLLRPIWLQNMIMTSDGVSSDTFSAGVSPLIYAAAIFVAVLIEIFIPLSAIISAIRTPIRDIIFSNRDTEYQVSPTRTCIGAGMIAAGLLFGFVIPGIICKIAAILLITVGMAFTVQAIIRFLTVRISAFFGARRMPVTEFAACEAGSKKSDMGNAVLAVTTIIAASAIFLIGADMLHWAQLPKYDADIIVKGFENTKYKDLEYIQELRGIDEAVYVYSRYDSVKAGRIEQTDDLLLVSTDETTEVFALPQTDMMPGLGDLPDSLDTDDALMDQSIAEKYGMKPGDTAEITFRCDGFFPMTRSIRLVGYAHTLTETESGGIILSDELFHLLYGAKPDLILIRAADPALAKESLEHAITENVLIQTREEYTAEKEENSRTMRMALYTVIAAALLLTLIGISGNQLVGFESRRKEYALLHSTSMTRKQIARLIFLENGFSFGISVVLAVICSIPVTLLIIRIVKEAGMAVSMSVRLWPLLCYIVVIWLVVMLTALAPIRRLRHMNTANEIKYE